MFHIFKKERGFTLLEVIITIFVITVGIIGVSIVAQDAMRIASISSSRLTAAYLAKEGIEIVRNIRDTNWLRGAPWNDGLGAGNWEADYNDSSLMAWAGRFLYIDGADNFYKYITLPKDLDIRTKFKRKIIIAPLAGVDGIKVKVEVDWAEKGRDYNFSTEEHLYNWRQ